MRKFLLLSVIFFGCSGILMAQKKQRSKTGTHKKTAFTKDNTRVGKTIVLKNGTSSPAVAPKDKKN